MSEDWIVVLAPEDRFIANGGWERFPGNLPSWPTAKVIEALNACDVLKHEGLTYWGDNLPEFTIHSEKVNDIFFSRGGAPLDDIIAICQSLAVVLGPVTLINALTDERVQVKAGMTTEEIWENLKPPLPKPDRRPETCPKCGRKVATKGQRCIYCGHQLV